MRGDVSTTILGEKSCNACKCPLGCSEREIPKGEIGSSRVALTRGSIH